MLSSESRALTEAGLLDRKDYGVIPPKAEYRLTGKEKSFVPIIDAMRKWGTRHLRRQAVDAGRGGGIAVE